MSVTIYKGQVLTKNDLNVYILDTNGNYVDPFSITYTIYRLLGKYPSGKGKSEINKGRGCGCRGNDTIVHGPEWWEQGEWLEKTQGTHSPQYLNKGVDQTTSTSGYFRECGEEPILETMDSVPIPFGIGKYFAAWNMSHDLEIGQFRIHWNVRRFPDSTIYEENEEFRVINKKDTLIYSQLNGSSTNLPHLMFGNQNLCAG